MLFAILCKDKPGHLQLRLDTRPAHVDFLNALNAQKKLAFAGPFLGSDGKPDGSMVVIDAADLGEAEQIAASDPYDGAGLFESVQIKPWNWVFNNPANP
ncbi:MAG: hypothetical protein KF874_14210 [Rhizobiaceae bacterium]|nr:hypothetical protein [Rhizobiaceae bacterium]